MVLNAFRKWIAHSKDLFSSKHEQDISLEDHPMKINIESFVYEDFNKEFLLAFYGKEDAFRNWHEFTKRQDEG